MMPAMKFRTKSRGVTLLELMTGIAVLGILISIAVPSFRSFSANSRTTTANNNLVTALAVARSEALRRGDVVRVCGSADMEGCSEDPDWSTGWLAFVDRNNDGAVDGGDAVVQVWSGPDGGVKVTADLDSIAYNSMGMMQPNGQAVVTFLVVPPSCTGERAIQASLNTAGTVRSTRVGCPP
jgi:type IV fimbrial biogenesis protein FimT